MSPELADEPLWAAIGEPSRRWLLDALLLHGEATPTMLAARVPFSRQAVSKHLAVLAEAGLVRRRRQGREARYAVEPRRMREAVRALALLARRWDERLLAREQAVERRQREELRSPGGSSPGRSPGERAPRERSPAERAPADRPPQTPPE